MKQGIHPEYQEVVFMDSATGAKFVAGSTLKSKETVDYEGKTYPLIRVEITSDSHPFYTGKQKFAQADGRIEKFNKKYGMNEKQYLLSGGSSPIGAAFLCKAELAGILYIQCLLYANFFLARRKIDENATGRNCQSN